MYHIITWKGCPCSGHLHQSPELHPHQRSHLHHGSPQSMGEGGGLSSESGEKKKKKRKNILQGICSRHVCTENLFFTAKERDIPKVHYKGKVE